MKRRAFRPDAVEGVRLEPRALLSSNVSPRVVMVRAIGRGTYSQTIFPNANSTTTLTGKVQLDQRRGKLNATLHGVGLVGGGNAVGVVYVGTKVHRLNLAITGETPVGTGAGVLPRRYEVAIGGGTGKYANSTGTGVAILGLRPLASAGRFRMLIRLNLDPSEGA